ncbi:MAG TPA: PIN domain-containing protein [Hyphomicrobiaceae bacterium]|nr:PIN domain-containing protein [Hyphomicrobiaceae bacterium]
MIGLDTNVVVRWLVSPQADLLSSDAELEQVARVVNDEGASLFINVVTVAETAWIMEKRLDLGRDVVSAIISRLLFAQNITLGNDLEMRAALLLYTSSSIGFADCLIAKLNLAAGCTHTLTFDKKASRTADFRHVDDR